MGRYYKTYTEIRFRHNYYADGLLGDLTVVPTAETADLLRKYRLQWGALNKQQPSSYELLRTQSDISTPIVPLPDQYQLRFEMYARNPDILTVTQGMSPQNGDIYLFENQADNVSLMGPSLRKMRLFGDMVALHDWPAGQDAVVTPPDGGATWAVVGLDVGAARHLRVNLEGKPAGIYNLAWATGNVDVYHDPQLVQKGIFAILHLTVRPGLDIGNHVYTLSLMAKTMPWKYYVLFKGGLSGCTYSVQDMDPSPHPLLHFNPLSTPSSPALPAPQVTTFTYTPPAPPATGDPLLDSAMVASNISEAMLFVSDVAVSYRDVARSFLVLQRDSGSQVGPVVKHLPNPPIGNANGAVIVMVDPPVI